ncbi:MAG: PAS domain S-box protein [Candidatus Accumulibacter sp.]|nr:PAS domain S-box protein [Accumulibacter sp.]
MPFGKPPLAAPQPLATLKQSNWYLIVLKLAVGLLLVLLIVLFWVLHQKEAEEERSTLIADVLWLGQNINFHLEGNAGNFQQLAHDLSRERDKNTLFRLRAEHLLKTNPDILQIVWFDEAGAVRGAEPRERLSALAEEDGAMFRHNVDMARKLGKSVYTDAYSTPEGPRFEMYSPVFNGGRYQGVLVSVYSFGNLLKDIVPWWFAEKYQVRILDGGGGVLATKSREGNVIDMSVNYAIPLDPPGFGMVLKVDVYRDSGNFVQNLLTASVLVLATATLFSLRVTRAHIRRRIAAEQAQREEYVFRKAMEDSLTVGMRARDLRGKVIYVNSSFCHMMGFSESELLNASPPMPYWAPEELERSQEIHDAVIDGKALKEGWEVRLMRKDGSRLDTLIYEAPLIGADGRQAGWMSSFVDITARKQAEELAQRQQEKLEATSRLVTMGELASTLAHELNQPLAAIASYTAGCLNKLESGDFSLDEIKAALAKLGAQTQRAGRIVRHVHDFVRKREPKLVPFSLGDAIDGSIALIEPAAKLAYVRIEREILAHPPELMGDQGQIEQVLLNLMRNGIEAMSAMPSERRRLTVRVNPAADQVRICVIDRGPGIPEELREQLFTPFFSTKADGMGMGLNICRSIIEFHRGRLWIEENPEGGAILTISLPVRQT